MTCMDLKQQVMECCRPKHDSVEDQGKSAASFA